MRFLTSPLQSYSFLVAIPFYYSSSSSAYSSLHHISLIAPSTVAFHRQRTGAQVHSLIRKQFSTGDSFIIVRASASSKIIRRLSFSRPSLVSSYSSFSSMTRSMSTSLTTFPHHSNINGSNNNKVALLQFQVSEKKEQNLVKALDFMTRAVQEGQAHLLVLPEIWNSPYATLAFPEYAEVLPDVGYEYTPEDTTLQNESPSVWLLLQFAKQHGVYLVGGSIPECSSSSSSSSVSSSHQHHSSTDVQYYNTCLCIDPQGKILAKHRKLHLFDIDVPGRISFRESDTLTKGNPQVTYFDTQTSLGRIGIGICYDIRFPEYALLLTQTYKCTILIYPGAFNLTTGPAHWELLQRARAVDGQCFVITASPARSDPVITTTTTTTSTHKYPHYSAWGHSSVTSPWGDVLATCDEKETIVYCDLDMTKVEEMRQSIPTRTQKRKDVYTLTDAVVKDE